MRQFKVNDELINKIKKLINNDSKDKLVNILDELHYADLAEIFESLEIIEVIFLVKIFDKEKIADALAEIDEDLREIILENLSEKEIAEFVKFCHLKNIPIEVIGSGSKVNIGRNFQSEKVLDLSEYSLSLIHI